MNAKNYSSVGESSDGNNNISRITASADNCNDVDTDNSRKISDVGDRSEGPVPNTPNSDSSMDQLSPNDYSGLSNTWSLRQAMEVEKKWDVFKQSCVPFLVAGVGSIGAGQALHSATQTEPFLRVPELVALTTPLMGLKGNLDLTFGSRLTTMAHQGSLRTTKDARKKVPVYMIMLQFQAISMSLLAAVSTAVLMFIKQWLDLPSSLTLETRSSIRWGDWSYLCSSAMLTITSSSFCMAFITVTMILIIRRLRMNPDNMISPIIASVGDLICMLLLLGMSYLLFERPLFIYLIILTIFICLLPLWLYLSWKEPKVREVLTSSWISILIAIFLQSCAGCVLDVLSFRYPESTYYIPLLSGIAGNRVCVQASRISSFLHTSACERGTLPVGKNLLHFFNPKRSLFGNDPDVQCSRMLLFTAIPYQALFLCLCYLIHWIISQSNPQTLPKINFTFSASYLATAFCQIAFLLYCTQLLCFSMWRLGIDPDFHSIPLLTGLGDLTGTLAMFLLYTLLDRIDKDSITINPQINNSSSIPVLETTMDVVNSTTVFLN